MVYRLAQLAQDDLDEISSYLGQHNLRAAERLLDEMYGRFELLSNQPRIGKLRDDLLPGLRCSVVRKYVIFCRAVDADVEILRVVHNSRDLEAIRFE